MRWRTRMSSSGRRPSEPGCAASSVSSPSSRTPETTREMPERSKSSVVVATYQPRFSSPTMLAAGTRTSSKKTSLKW